MSGKIAFNIPVPTAAVQRYATISGDHNPLHLDEAFAKRAGFAGPIVHGMFTLALSYEGMFAHFKGKRCLDHLSVRFREPLYPDDILCVRGEENDPCFSVTSATGRALFKQFEVSWKTAPKKFEIGPFAPLLLENFSADTITLKPTDLCAYQELLASLFPDYCPDSPPLLLLAQSFIVQLLKHLEPTKPLASHRILHLAQEIFIFGTLPLNHSFVLTGGITQKSHKMGQDFIHFFQKFSTQDQTFQMVGKGFGVVQLLS